MKKSMKKMLALLLSVACAVPTVPVMTVGATEVTEVTDGTDVWKVAKAAEENESINVAAYKNGGVADADNVTVTMGDVTFLNDGTYTNMWVSSTSAPVSGWVTFDDKYLIDTVRVVFKEGENVTFTASYYDNGSYHQIYSGAGYDEANDEAAVGHKYYKEIKLDNPVVTNKIKVTVNSSSASLATIAEIEAFGTEYDPTKAVSNLSLNATATASFVDWEREASRAIDGNLGTYWDGAKTSPENPQWIMVDLGDDCKITEIKATTYHDAGDGRYYLYYIEVSSDGKEWTKIADREETYGTVPAYVGEAYTFDEVEARYVRVTVTLNSANGYCHMKELEIWGRPAVIRENVALGKTVTASGTDNGGSADRIVDGDYSNYWDGGQYPSYFIIDLGSGYFVDMMKAYPYNDGRTYAYHIEYSLDGKEFTKIFDRPAEDGPAQAGETFELEEPVEMRFVKVTMTYNSANFAVHMKEFEVFGVENPDYELPNEDLVDPDNLAFGKKVITHLSTKSVQNVTDGLDVTACSGEFAPAYFDIDLEQNYDLSEILLSFPVNANGYYYYTVYGSVDGSNYDRLFQQRSQEPELDGVQAINLKELGLETTEYRIVRIWMEYAYGSSSAILSEIRIHGEAMGTNTEPLRTGSIDEVLGIQHFNETKYAAPITEEETIENVYGIVERNVGKEYRDWFTFVLAENTENDNDYFTIGQDPVTGKIVITGNDGVSLASGLHKYLRDYCNCLITEQTKQVKMPAEIAAVKEPVRCETPYKVRYAFNYCTLNYTFSYADLAEFVRENDWLALNGVNCVIDLAGQEAVWIKFLQNFGYTFDEAKDWIAGPSYYAWQFMDNLEVVGGPVSDEWVVGRLEMARETQRFKNSLGMQTVFQGYAGMIPCNFADYQDVEILDQGTWCNLPRPDMIRTDGALYDKYAELFYAAQEWAFGATSDYYAVDPFHEGGIRPSDLSDETIAENVLESLLKYDPDGIWMVQAWWSNPSVELLRGMGEFRQDHVVILDLTGVGGSKWDKLNYGSTYLDTTEFNGTDWVCCLLDNYGGNPSMDGNLQLTIDEVVRARDTAQHMKGIGIIPEATYMNPVLYQILFDMTWVAEGTVDLDDWIDDYITDRYGAYSENARKGWEILLKSVYGREGGHSQVLASSGGLGKHSLPYTAYKAEQALQYLFKDFDLLCESESYLYDLTELMRQVVNNYSVIKQGELKDAHDAKDVEAFKTLKAEYLYLFDLFEKVLGTQSELMVGNWIGGAEDWAINTGADDFAYDSMVENAKTIITVWAASSNLGAYAYRHYEGMFRDLYKPMQEAYLNRLEEILETGTSEIQTVGYTKGCMEWIYGDYEYNKAADNSIENMRKVTQEVIEVCDTYVVTPENIGNIALNKPVSFTHERPNSPGAVGGGYAANITDGSNDTYWDGIDWAYKPEAVVDLEDEYSIDKINVVCYVAGSRYYQYDLYASVDGEDWTQILDGTSTAPETDAGKDYVFEDLTARYIKIVGKYNSSNEGFHVREIRVFGEEAVTKQVLEIVKQPVSATVDTGVNAEVTVDVVGDGLTYTWYYKNPGNKKFYVSGDSFVTNGGATYSIPMYAWRDGQEVYCVITDAYGDIAITNTVKVSLRKAAITIVEQPVDVCVAKGENAVVSVTAEGEGLTYTWYYKNPGNVKFYVSGTDFVSEDGTQYIIPMAAWRNGQQVYCEITDANGDSVQTNIVTLTMAE